MKVSYFSPLPPSTSGIADYSALLLPALERLVEVEVVRPGRTRPVGGADVAVYHVGNDPDAHAWIVDALRRRPGVVVLHDFVIHHLVVDGVKSGDRVIVSGVQRAQPGAEVKPIEATRAAAVPAAASVEPHS